MRRLAEHAGEHGTAGNMNVDGALSTCAVRVTDAGFTYEMALPSSQMPRFSPGFGRKLGFSLTCVDRDPDGETASLHWGAGAGDSWEPSQFGVLTFIDETEDGH